MSLLFLALLAPAAVAAPPAGASVHPPAVEEKLAPLVGDWTIQGLAKTQFRQKCSWFGTRALVLCSFDDRRSGIKGQLAFGYSALEKRFTYTLLDSTGRHLHQLGFPYGKYALVFIGERLDPLGPARFQTSFLVGDDGLVFTEFRSVAAGDWQKVQSYVLVPVNQSPAAKRRR